LEVKVEKLYSGKKTSGFKVAPSGAPAFFLKVFHHPLSLKGALSALFTSTRPAREFKYSRILRERGFPVPEVVSCRVRRLWGVFPVNIGCTKAVYLEGLTPLYRVMGSKEFGSYLRDAVLLLARLHREGFIHSDISLLNFALYRGRVFLIDLEGVYRAFWPLSGPNNFLRFLNDLLKRGAVFEPGRLTELYIEAAGVKLAGGYLRWRVSKLLEERKG